MYCGGVAGLHKDCTCIKYVNIYHNEIAVAAVAAVTACQRSMGKLLSAP